MRKDRDTTIIPIRVKNDLVPQIKQAVSRSRQPSRNSWLNWLIKEGLRPHTKKEK